MWAWAAQAEAWVGAVWVWAAQVAVAAQVSVLAARAPVEVGQAAQAVQAQFWAVVAACLAAKKPAPLRAFAG